MPITLKPQAIKKKRLEARLNPRQAAGLLYLSELQYLLYENGVEKMPYGLYELLSIKTGLIRNQRMMDAMSEMRQLINQAA